VLEEGMNVKIVLLPDGEDPDSYSKKVSNEEFRAFIRDNETDFIRFKTRMLLSEAKSDPVQRANLIRDIVKSIAVIPETITRTVYIKECSTQLEVPEAVLYNEVNKLRSQKTFQDRNKYPGPEDLPTYKETVQKQIVIDAVIKNSESEVIRLLLKFGDEIFGRKLNHEDGIETVTTVADFIVNEIESDELKFENQILTEIYNECLFSVKQGLPIGDHHFIRNSNPDIARVSAEFLVDSYELSKIWKEKQTFVLTELEVLKDLVEDAVLKFKRDKISVLKKSLEPQIAEAEKAGDMKKVSELIQRSMIYSGVIKEISEKLGDRII
jgi:DNA primase